MSRLQKMSANLIHQVTSSANYRDIIKNNSKVMVDFYAEWCGPCKAIAPKIGMLASEHPGIKFLKVDVDEVEDITEELGITAMPTFVFYQDGVICHTITGANLPAISGKLASW